MSSAALNDLIAAFEESRRLNQEILEKLAKGDPLESLDKLFKTKASALEALKKAAAGLEGGEKPPSPEMARAFEVQTSSARLEAKLAEVLGAQRQNQENVTAITKAYGQKGVDKKDPARLDLET